MSNHADRQDAAFHRTHLSLYYLAGYLVPTGLALLFAPALVFRLMFSNSNGAYGDVFPRMAGGLILALGIIVIQIIRHRVSVLYSSTLGVRLVLLGVLLWLYARAADPFFLAVSGVVLLGVALTGASYLLDRKSPGETPLPA